MGSVADECCANLCVVEPSAEQCNKLWGIDHELADIKSMSVEVSKVIKRWDKECELIEISLERANVMVTSVQSLLNVKRNFSFNSDCTDVTITSLIYMHLTLSIRYYIYLHFNVTF